MSRKGILGCVFFFLTQYEPIASLMLQLFCHHCVSLKLVENELLDDVSVDELGAVQCGHFFGVKKNVCERFIELMGDACVVISQCFHIAAVEGLPFVGQVEVVNGIVEYVSEHRFVYVIGDFILRPQSCYIIEVELERAFHICVDGRRRQDMQLVESCL